MHRFTPKAGAPGMGATLLNSLAKISFEDRCELLTYRLQKENVPFSLSFTIWHLNHFFRCQRRIKLNLSRTTRLATNKRKDRATHSTVTGGRWRREERRIKSNERDGCARDHHRHTTATARSFFRCCACGHDHTTTGTGSFCSCSCCCCCPRKQSSRSSRNSRGSSNLASDVHI